MLQLFVPVFNSS